MKRPTRGSTPKQFAYATRRFNGDGQSKKEIARMVGYSPATASNAKTKIESTEGYHNAMKEIALKSNHMMLAALSEFEARGLKEFSNTELTSALNAIGAAWERVNKQQAPNKEKEGVNLLRQALQKTQIIDVESKEAEEEPETNTKEEPDLDF